VEFLLSINVEVPSEDIQTIGYFAGAGARMDILRYICEIRPEICTPEYFTDALFGASGSGHLNVIKFLFETCGTIEGVSEALTDVVWHGYYEIADYLYPRMDEPWTAACMSDCIEYAVCAGDLDALSYLCEKFIATIPRKEIAKEVAKRDLCSDHQEMIDYLERMGLILDTDTGDGMAFDFNSLSIGKKRPATTEESRTSKRLHVAKIAPNKKRPASDESRMCKRLHVTKN
jgi:hypothetical protein